VSVKLDDLPEELRQEAYLRDLTPRPTEWVTVWASESTDDRNGGVAAYLATLEESRQALSGATWAGYGLGKADSYRQGDECVFTDGMSDGQTVRFFVHVLTHHRVAPARVEFVPSFLWFFEAVPRGKGDWYYLSRSGADLDLVRVDIGEDAKGTVKVAAMPLRRYLAASKQALVVQHDYVVFSDEPIPETGRFEFKSESMHLQLDAVSEPATGRTSHSRLLGKHLVLPLEGDPCGGEDDLQEGPFPAFIYGIDQATGEPLSFTCEESKLTNNFVKREGAPHYLTPVYFRREVLTRYTQQPGKYTVAREGISCLDLWSLRMDINPEGLVEVYLGDLGKYLPSEERDYWRSFNVPPVGGMSEYRFNRDFLAQFVDSDDPIRDLHRGRHRANEASEKKWARQLYMPLHPEDRSAWDGIHLMTTGDPSERDRLVVVLAKGLVDSLDVELLRHLAERPDGRSLELLEELVVRWGGDPEVSVTPLRLVQSMRSSGAAHVRGHKYASLLSRSGLEDLSPDKQFERLVRLSAGALNSLTELIEHPADSNLE
jgi:hypothetical protein